MSDPFTHGTSAGYERHHCRCDKCRTYQNDRVRRNRAERLARVEKLVHGIRSTYDAGCRCTKCKQARHNALVVDVQTAALRRASA
jgi:hypothetical protein